LPHNKALRGFMLSDKRDATCLVFKNVFFNSQKHLRQNKYHENDSFCFEDED